MSSSTTSKGTTKRFSSTSSQKASSGALATAGSGARPGSQQVGSSKKRIPSSSGSTSSTKSKRKLSSGSTPSRDNKTQNYSFSDQGMYSTVSLKNEKAVLLNDEEMISEFEKQKRRLERLAFVMKLPFIDVEYFFNAYGSEYNIYNLHQLSMVVDLLENHKLKTIQVTEAIWEREDVLDKLHCLVEEYNAVKDSNPGLILVAQKEALILQKDIQKKGLKIVELIDKWRKDLSLDYPFRFMEYTNYLIKMRYDLEFVDNSDLSHYIFPFRGHPLLANVPSLYYENIEKLLEVPDKKNPSLSATVTYPLTKKKLKLADKAMNAERKLNKYEAIILREEDNERTIKQFLFTLIKKGKFITVLNVSEGEFELTPEQQQKIKGIFNQSPEYVISYFNLHARVNLEPQFPEKKPEPSTPKSSEKTIQNDVVIIGSVIAPTPKAVSNGQVFLTEEEDDELDDENRLGINNEKGYASDITDDIEFEIIEKKQDQNNSKNYDGSGEETEEENAYKKQTVLKEYHTELEATHQHHEPLENQNPLSLNDSLDEKKFQNPYQHDENRDEEEEENEEEEREENTFGYSNPYEDEEPHKYQHEGEVHEGDKRDEEGNDFSRVYGLDNIEAPNENHTNEDLNIVDNVHLETEYPENHEVVHATSVETPILGDIMEPNLEVCPPSPKYHEEPTQIHDELSHKEPENHSTVPPLSTNLEEPSNETAEDSYNVNSFETPRDFDNFSNPYGDEEDSQKQSSGSIHLSTPVLKGDLHIGTPLMQANIHFGDPLVVAAGSSKDKDSKKSKHKRSGSNSSSSSSSSGSDFSDFGSDFSD
ncbi:predicted protein [Naegleria gruberi]|uniref:Predicted protein n=1 Tax=Naegleria gruberi TaxID=5762 RepID=D2V459_NAEGR|nr:uncharacterized protein NAEGRDRAFT_63605 [Naegleria gruberi]EFC48325.1 predicted protein [Naegleria gruberi]|eukprot:XP_002681069.1 predicted protein [Naegleria gruberi strain NEG-M]